MTMLHLAQVRKHGATAEASLQLLAVQRSDYLWALVDESDPIPYTGNLSYGDGALVLVDLAETQDIQSIEDATAWVLDLVAQYLSSGLSPADLKEEVERAEQWRQSLTLRSQELGRQALEMEARRDQIHELEKNLKEEKDKLEAIAAQLKSAQNNPESEDA